MRGQGAEETISPEHLVPSVARESHGQIATRLACDDRRRQGRGVGERLVEPPEDERNLRLQAGRVDRHEVVQGPEALRGEPGRIRLVEIGEIRDPHRVRARRRAQRAAHQRHDGRRVETARQEGAQGHVRLETAPHRLFQHPAHRLPGSLVGGEVPAIFQAIVS